mmetsp:Transcript_110078/g.322000  ORF Transcript_110078/g.322000 Transcript_110078/m.322000 type:complete len:370 (-) Transcript_110078:174-1283(-)
MSDNGVHGAFQKYPKMAETSGTVGAGSAAFASRYIVTEKVHGANFCLIARRSEDDHMTVQFAKRTAIIGDEAGGEDFYSFRSTGLLQDLIPRAKGVLARLPSEMIAAHIYGELYGGSYPHLDVQPVPKLQPVQCGVWYCPDIRFLGFDVAVEHLDAAGVLRRRFLDFSEARSHCEAAGLTFAAPLFEGSLSECVDFSEVFETTIPQRLGLPRILDAGGGNPNIAEGVVVRPAREPATCSGAPAECRGLFKRKAPAFSEKRYQNDGWRKGKAGGAGRAPQAEREDLVRIEIRACVVPARLHAVQSKVGLVDVCDRPAVLNLLEMFKDDVREALEDEDLAMLNSSSTLQAELEELCKDCMRSELVARKCTG